MATPQELRETLIGAWTLISCRVEQEGAPPYYPVGEDAKGIIMYTPDGYMSADLMRVGRSKFKAGDMKNATQEELAEAIKGYITYSGRYDIVSVKGEGGKEAKVMLRHHMDVALFPNWEDDTQERLWTIEDGVLTLRPDEAVLFDVSVAA